MTDRAPRRGRSRVTLLAVTVALLAVPTASAALALPASARPAPAVPASAGAGAQPGATTSTLPEDNRTFGDIVPAPNSGRAPESPGDPGGWLQVSLFFLLCAAVLVIVGVVWWQSRRARTRLAAAGKDPVSLAKARGEGLRRPPDPNSD